MLDTLILTRQIQRGQLLLVKKLSITLYVEGNGKSRIWVKKFQSFLKIVNWEINN